MLMFLHLVQFSFTDVRENTFSQAGKRGDLLCQLNNPLFATDLYWGFFNSWSTNFSGSCGLSAGGVGS